MRKKAIKLRKVLSLVLAFALLAGMLPMEWSTFVAKAADSYELVENAEVNDLLYFVDAGSRGREAGPFEQQDRPVVRRGRNNWL